mgnify:CR=1 FL=1|jgi:hypothetical protein
MSKSHTLISGCPWKQSNKSPLELPISISLDKKYSKKRIFTLKYTYILLCMFIVCILYYKIII